MRVLPDRGETPGTLAATDTSPVAGSSDTPDTAAGVITLAVNWPRRSGALASVSLAKALIRFGDAVPPGTGAGVSGVAAMTGACTVTMTVDVAQFAAFNVSQMR